MRIIKCDRCGKQITGNANHISVWSEGGEPFKASKYSGWDFCDECTEKIDEAINILEDEDSIDSEIARIEKAINDLDDEVLNKSEDDEGSIFESIYNIITSLLDIKDEMQRLEETGHTVLTVSANWDGKLKIHVPDIHRVAEAFGARLNSDKDSKYFDIDGVEVFGPEDKA